MRKSINIHRYVIYFMLSSLLLPLIVLGVTNAFLFYDSLKNEILQEDKAKVLILSNSIRNFIRSPLVELNLTKEFLNYGIEDNDSFNSILGTLIQNQDDIFKIDVTNLKGEIIFNYPQDKSLIGTDVSGYEFYNKSLNQAEPLWSSTFLSSQTLSATVTLSQAYNNGVITFYISVNRIEEIIKLLGQEKTKRVIFITDKNGVFVYHPDKSKVERRERYNLNNLVDPVIIYNGQRYFTHRVVMPETGWNITLYTPFKTIYGPIFRLILPLISILLIVLSIALIIGKRFSDKIIFGIGKLLGLTRNIYLGDYEIEIKNLGLDELNQLGHSIVDMSKKISTRERDLNKVKDEISNHKLILENEVELQTRELRNTLESLHEAQDTIIESEKMVALGSMVAGIAHEINTPVGIIVTASSFLQDQTVDLLDDYNNNKLGKKSFTTYCENVISTTSLILSNSKRSAELIRSFKQVAVDQTNDDLRKIFVKDYVESIITSLQPNFKKTNYTVNLDVKENYQVETFPGAIAQIITNLIFNSIKHGFEGLDKGEIHISISIQNDVLNLVFIDDGIGMSQENVKKIYEPFFTTKRSSGGSGLGMHIVYNLVTQKLKGSVSCTSKLKLGTSFELNFPVRIV